MADSTTSFRGMTIVSRVLIALLASGVLLSVVGVSSATAQDRPAQQCADIDSPRADSLLIATKPLPPFVFVEGETVRGFSIDYWHAVADRLGAETTWCTADTVDEIIDLATTADADAAIAGISITEARERVIDFSQPYYTSGQQIVTKQGGSNTAGALLGLVFSRAFLFPVGVLLLLVLIVSHLVWFFERGHESEDFPYAYRQGIGEAIWWSTVSVITGGEAVKNINTALSRLIAIFWMLVGLFLLAFVTARATSLLTVAALESDIAGLEDLAGRSVTTVEATATVDFLNARGVAVRQQADLAEALADLDAGRTDAVVFDAPVLQYEILQTPGLDVQLVEPTLGRDPYGIAMPEGSDLIEGVNAAVIEIGRDGTLDQLLTQWFGES